MVAGLIGVGVLIGAYQAAQNAAAAHGTENALNRAQACPAAPAGWEADCVQSVPATVLDALETGGKNAVYEIDVLADGTARSVHFPHGNPLTHSSVEGDRVTLTVWRGHVEAMTGQGVDEATSEVPDESFRHSLAGATALLGLALIVLSLAVVLTVTDPSEVRRWGAFGVLATVFSGIVLLLSGMGLGSGTSLPLNTVITGVLIVAAITGAALIVDPGRRRDRTEVPGRPRMSKRPVRTASRKPVPAASRKPVRAASRKPVPAVTTRGRASKIAAQTRTKARARRREPSPKSRHGALLATAQLYLGLGTVFVLIIAAVQCIPGRAHDHAPLCPAGVIGGSCRADTTLTVRGVRNSGRTVVFDGPQGSQIATTLVSSGSAVDTVDTRQPSRAPRSRSSCGTAAYGAPSSTASGTCPATSPATRPRRSPSSRWCPAFS